MLRNTDNEYKLSAPPDIAGRENQIPSRLQECMMPTDEVSPKDIKAAREFWSSGDLVEAGRIIFERLPNGERPGWAANLLRLVLAQTGVDVEPFARILDDADHPERWSDGHRTFLLLRDRTLEFDKLRRQRDLTDSERDFAAALGLAELVAKVTYNASDPLGPFDEDSGWWIVECVKNIVNRWSDDRFAVEVWRTVHRWNYGTRLTSSI